MKTSGSYNKVMLGVSQQTPQDRREGQHWEQVNCISDPVRGVVRRQGSKHETTKLLGDYVSGDAQALLDDVKNYRSMDFLVGDNQYTIVYRKKAMVAGSAAPFCFIFDKQTRQFLDVVVEDPSTLLDSLTSGGVSALANVGRYLYIAGNTIVPGYTVVDMVNSEANKKHAIAWVRSGNYGKKYTCEVFIRRLSDNVQFTISGEFETDSSAYPGVLDTSDILASDPEYQKKVNDRTNDYNTAVTLWIGTSAKSALQSNIANEVKLALEADRDTQSLTSAITFELSENTIGMVAQTDYVIENVVATDEGDNTSFLAVANTVSTADELSAEHYPGKIVKIRPKKSDESDSYYMKAVKREDESTIVGLQEVTWIQAAGEVTTPVDVFAFATVEDDVFYLAGSSSGLKTISGMTDDVPGWVPSAVGDTISTAIPAFLGNRVDYLGSFQDRLVIGFKSTLTFSRPGRYLNLFRSDVLSVLDDDPVEIYPNGSEDDTILASAQFQGNTLLFGTRKQYLLNGKNRFTPSTAMIITVGAHEDAIDMDPVAAGNYVFYGKGRLGYSSVHQFQGGVVADTPESYEISAQVDKYMPGFPVQALALTTPNTILLRTDGMPNGFFVYSYLDAGDGSQRLFDSWSKWQWHEALGQVAGWTFARGDISVFTVRHGKDWTGADKWFIVSDMFTLDIKLDDKPYLDSQRPYSAYAAMPADEWFTDLTEDAYVAFDASVRQHLIGQPLANVENLTTTYPDDIGALQVGVTYDAYFSPTNPYVRDQQGKSIVDARTVINQFVVSVDNSAGIEATVHTKANPEGYLAGYTNGRQLGRLVAELGVQPIATGSFRFNVGRDNAEFTYRLKAVKWFPMSVSAITWLGQFFSRTRRIT